MNSQKPTIAILPQNNASYVTMLSAFFTEHGLASKIISPDDLISYTDIRPRCFILIVIGTLAPPMISKIKSCIDLSTNNTLAIINLGESTLSASTVAPFSQCLFHHFKRPVSFPLVLQKTLTFIKLLTVKENLTNAIQQKKAEISTAFNKEKKALSKTLMITLHHELRNALTAVYTGSQILNNRSTLHSLSTTNAINAIIAHASMLKQTVDTLDSKFGKTFQNTCSRSVFRTDINLLKNKDVITTLT